MYFVSTFILQDTGSNVIPYAYLNIGREVLVCIISNSSSACEKQLSSSYMIDPLACIVMCREHTRRVLSSFWGSCRGEKGFRSSMQITGRFIFDKCRCISVLEWSLLLIPLRYIEEIKSCIICKWSFFICEYYFHCLSNWAWNIFLGSVATQRH